MKNTDQVNEAKNHSGQAVSSPHSAQERFACGHPIYMRTRDDIHYCKDYPNGVKYNADDDEEEEGCTIQVDLGQSCGKPITRVVHEPYTPASFKVECCEEHAESLIQFGYLRGK